MTTLKTMDSSLLSLLVLLLIYGNAYNRSEKYFTQYRLFILLVQTNMALIVVDILGWVFNGLPGPLYLAANKGFNLLLFIMEPTGAVLWVIYTSFQVFHDEARIRRLIRPLLALFAANGVLSVASLYTGWFFWVDSRNIYHRGNYSLLHVLICYAMLFYAVWLVYRHRAQMEKRHYYALLLYALPIAVGVALQTLWYGVSFTWSGMMLSLLIIYFNIQEKGLNTDYLTGVSNRRQLDSYIEAKVKNGTGTFAAILMDLDGFKKINDQFGHDAGDEALREAVKIIRGCLRKDDFIARYGGDEFLAVMDALSRQELEQIVDRIRDSVRQLFSPLEYLERTLLYVNILLGG